MDPLDFSRAPRYNRAISTRTVNPMTPEKNSNRLTRWMLIATIVLLLLVLGLQLWQMFGGRKTYGNNGSLVPDSANGPAAPSQTEEALNPPASNVSPGKAAMIEDVRLLNDSLSAEDLSKLSAEELEQLWETGAPGLPIGASAAAVAAETYAGTLEVDSVTSKTDPELDESPAHYEVELRHPTFGEFEYKIDAYSGEVLEGVPNILILQNSYVPASEQEVPTSSTGKAPAAPAPEAPASKTPTTEAPAPKAPSTGTQAPAPGGEKPASVDEEAAKNAAFTHAGVSAADATVTKCKLDWEDGRQVYEIEFWVDNTEYEYDVEAASGTVVKVEVTQDHRKTPAGATFIGEEAAKNAAFAHAGVSASEASGIKCELDEDDGRWLYEIEFHLGRTEYEYEIDAATGAVVKSEREH